MEEILHQSASWYGKYPIIYRVLITSQMVQDFFHQKYHPIWLGLPNYALLLMRLASQQSSFVSNKHWALIYASKKGENAGFLMPI